MSAELKLCKYGHLSERTANRQCVECKRIDSRLRMARKYKENPQAGAAKKRAQRVANPEAFREYDKARYAAGLRGKWWQDHPERNRAAASRARALKAQRMPVWANVDALKQIYANCPDGHHVDHVIPLRGKFVSGLHVESNLQYLPASENQRKYNTFEIGTHA